MNTKKIIFWVVVAAVLTIGTIMIVKASAPDPQKLADAETAKAKANPTPENIAAANSAQQTADMAKNVAPGFPLQRGSRGTEVKNMQQAMVDYYGGGDVSKVLPRYGVDGIFGAETLAAVKNNMGGDGTVTVVMYNALLTAAQA